jgi:hypothetical protein
VPAQRGRGCSEPRAEAPEGCPFLTYLAVVAGFAASFTLLGILI